MSETSSRESSEYTKAVMTKLLEIRYTIQLIGTELRELNKNTEKLLSLSSKILESTDVNEENVASAEENENC